MKKIKLFLLGSIVFLGSVGSIAQERDPKQSVADVVKKNSTTAKEMMAVKTDSLRDWKISGSVGVNSSATFLTNWAAGGNNSTSAILYGNMRLIYQKNKIAWETFFDTEFGYTYFDKTKFPLRKTNDKIIFNTKAGYDIGHKLYVTLLGSFRSQYAKGFEYLTTEGGVDTFKYISNWLSPSYTDISLGIDWKPNDIFSVYVSPSAGRITTCIDPSEQLRTMYGIDPKKTFRAEFGAMAKGSANYTYKQLKVISTITLFSPYSKNFGNVDIDWDTAIAYQFAKVFNVSLGTSLKYYDAIKFDTGDGKTIQRVQFKTVFGVGLGYTF